jgi:leucyl-tRNA synthetase
VEIIFRLLPESSAGSAEEADLAVFTTRPDTLYGATFLVLAPEHPQAASIAAADRAAAVHAVIDEVARRSERERSISNQEMAGEFTGRFAVHPLTAEPIPVWVADYVLPDYGTGAIMAVPAHDERDHAFASFYELPIVEVIHHPDRANGDIYTGRGILVNSGVYDSLDSDSAAERITSDLIDQGVAVRKTNYKMRDWLISRQRYWGAPIPILHCPTCGIVPVPEKDLPVLLPDTRDFAPAGDGRSPLARITDWVNAMCPDCGGPAQRETDTMDGFACSSWYFLRFASPHYQDGPFDPQAVRRWLPVDTYVGGAEHAVMHLLYARFWTKVLFDAGLVAFDEPFTRLLNQGVLHSAVDGQRMSKSRGNVVTPDEVVAAHGTDALRLYILFLGPFDADAVWDDRGIKGITRFLDRYWRLAVQPVDDLPQEGPVHAAFELQKHQVVGQVTDDMRRYRYNTGVAALMSYLNYLIGGRSQAINRSQWRSALETLTLLLSPMAPFITEEVWQSILGHPGSVHQQTWPAYDKMQARETSATIVVQVNGRLRAKLQVERGSSDESLRALVLGTAGVRRYLAGKEIDRMIIVPDRLVNIVVK